MKETHISSRNARGERHRLAVRACACAEAHLLPDLRELAAEDEGGECDEEEAADEERDGEEAPEEGARGDLAVPDGCYSCEGGGQ